MTLKRRNQAFADLGDSKPGRRNSTCKGGSEFGMSRCKKKRVMWLYWRSLQGKQQRLGHAEELGFYSKLQDKFILNYKKLLENFNQKNNLNPDKEVTLDIGRKIDCRRKDESW